MADEEIKHQHNSSWKTHKLSTAIQVCLRIFTISTTLAATIVVITNKQSIILFGMQMDARYSYSPAFKFLALANAVACGFSILSLLTLVCVGMGGKAWINQYYFLLFLHDMIMMALVLAGSAAATAIGYIGQHGDTHTGWMAICNRFGRFCHRMTLSVILSYLSVVFLLVLTAMSANRSRHIHHDV